jgi:tRNA U34 5-carboxymethylaminomethyl modifying GTPase MnmE/TrmE
VDKPFAVVVNKTDLMSKEQETMSNDYFAKPGINVLMVSAGTTKGIGELKEKLLRLVNLK